MNRRALAAALLAAGALFACEPAAQQPSPAPVFVMDCEEYAKFAQFVAFIRAVDGRLELVLEQVRARNGGVGAIRAQVLARETRAVYAEALSITEAGYAAFKRCRAVLGRFGPDA